MRGWPSKQPISPKYAGASSVASLTARAPWSRSRTISTRPCASRYSESAGWLASKIRSPVTYGDVVRLARERRTLGVRQRREELHRCERRNPVLDLAARGTRPLVVPHLDDAARE